jgi:hypothetical protein
MPDQSYDSSPLRQFDYSQAHSGRESTAMLRQLNPQADHNSTESELGDQLRQMFHLLHGILEKLEPAERTLESEPDRDWAEHSTDPTSHTQPLHEPVGTFAAPPRDVRTAAEPPTFAKAPPITWSVRPGTMPTNVEEEPDMSQSDAPDSPSFAHWWFNFSGDVSLGRLARFRQIVNSSPFTVDARFDEISDGLITLRLVTDEQFSCEQMDWIVRQILDNLAIDRHSVILSRE